MLADFTAQNADWESGGKGEHAKVPQGVPMLEKEISQLLQIYVERSFFCACDNQECLVIKNEAFN